MAAQRAAAWPLPFGPYFACHSEKGKKIFETVKNEAARYGVNIIGSEIIGLTPMQALLDVAEYYLRLDGFERKQVFEETL